jgi:hypothetical protein
VSVAIPPTGVTVPTGDPEALRGASRSLLAAAQTMEGVADGFQNAMDVCDSGGVWIGRAGYAYRIRVGETREAVRIGVSSMREAASAFARLADDLELSQRRALRAVEAAESAAGLVAIANAALLHVDGQSGDPQERLRHQRNLDYAEMDLAAARSAGESAAQDAVSAARTAAAALNHASDQAKAPPEPPPPDMEPTETLDQFIGRQLGDIFVDSIIPFTSGNSEYKEGRLTLDWPVGLMFGGTEAISKGYIANAEKYTPGFWSKLPTPVAGYERTLPSGRTIRVAPYHRRDGVYVPPRRVEDTEKKLLHENRAKWARNGGFGLGFVTAGIDRAVQDAGRPDLNGRERSTRIVLSTVAVGLGSIAGATIGGTIGSAIAPGPGTVVGGIVGGMVGAGVGEKVEGGLFKAFRVR